VWVALPSGLAPRAIDGIAVEGGGTDAFVGGEQALCLAIVVNAIIIWNSVYASRVLDELRAGKDHAGALSSVK
jgi:hypothetical protein